MLGNRILFAELAATAMLPHVDAACERWRPDLLLRDPCEYAGAIVAGTRSIRSAQVGISQAEVEWSSLSIASPALEQRRSGLTTEIASAPYISRFPDLIDPSPFATTLRYHTRPTSAPEALPDWWTPDPSRSQRGAQHVDEIRPLVVMPFFSDQRTNGRLVDRHRLGSVVVPTVSPLDQRPAFGHEDAEALTAAVSAVLEDRSSFDGFTNITADWDDTPSAADVLAQLVS